MNGLINKTGQEMGNLAHTFEHLSNYTSQEEITQALALLDDPDFAISGHVMFTAWGRWP